MSRFRSAPRKGHLERLQRVYGYVLKTKHYSTRYRTEEPDYTYLPDMKHDWSYTVYGNIQEIIPHDCPKPLGKSVTTTTALDANLLHCMATSASLTACLHFCNQTPTDWYSKKQATVETQHMDQSLWQPKQPQNRSWILDTHRGTLVYPLGLNHICLGTTGLWLQVLHYHTQP